MTNNINDNTPLVYKSVRALGILRPKFQPNQGRAFLEGIDVVGTTFWVKDYNVLVTCAHVVQGLLSAPIEITGLLVVGNLVGSYSRAVIGSIDPEHDLAVLRLSETSDEIVNKEASTGLTIVNQYPDVGQAVGYAGFPLGKQLFSSSHEPTYAEGVVGAKLRKGLTLKNIQITGAVAGGFSGSPIVLKDTSKLIGVLSNSPSKEAGQANIFMASSWEHVRAIVELAKS